MTIFEDYSAYYDLLYRDKDYRGEVAYLHQLIQRHQPGSRSLLNLGCGTGKHDFEFGRSGYDVVGIDQSQVMVDLAREKNSAPSGPEFHQGDVRTVRLGRKFDVVVSLFHVASYQTTNEDLRALFATAQAHLKDGGLFVFDFWYGPGVLRDPPVTRIKRVENESIELLRIAEPQSRYRDNIVDVHYEIRARDKATGRNEVIREKHSMRYLFLPELQLLAGQFQKVADHAWLTENAPEAEWLVVSIYKYQPL